VVSVADVIDEAAHRARAASEQHSVVVRVDHPSRPLRVVGSHRQLVSAVANLVENAVKYSEIGAEVVVRCSETNGWAEIAVVDTGVGIPARDIDRIFERFYRVDRARHRQTGGTGLGLSIVRHVATNHDGEVTVTSREGEGSTFTLRIPAGSQ
jgi:two-component system sensor histidine kinase SenX3